LAARRRAAGWGAGLRRWLLLGPSPPLPLLHLGLAGVGCGEGGWSAPAASMAGLMDSGRRPLEGRRSFSGGRRPLGAAGHSLGCVGSEVAADVGRAGVP
jgi:hypothetical protein